MSHPILEKNSKLLRLNLELEKIAGLRKLVEVFQKDSDHDYWCWILSSLDELESKLESMKVAIDLAIEPIDLD